MGDKGLDFKHKEVINICDGKRLGYVQDECADLESGRITSIIVPGGTNKLMSLFSNSNDIIIPWDRIKCIGDDLILVELWNKKYSPWKCRNETKGEIHREMEKTTYKKVLTFVLSDVNIKKNQAKNNGKN